MFRKRILVIEDNRDICDLLVARIRHWGFEATGVHDGRTGLEMAHQERPDLIVLDLRLPKLPGEEACRQIRKSEDIKNTPIIMETGKVSDADKVIGRVIGADCYLRKPYTSEQLHEQINRLLSEAYT
ncbi:response regulator transcription factor [Candidatus Omnitrophota bacterium]